MLTDGTRDQSHFDVSREGGINLGNSQWTFLYE